MTPHIGEKRDEHANNTEPYYLQYSVFRLRGILHFRRDLRHSLLLTSLLWRERTRVASRSWFVIPFRLPSSPRTVRAVPHSVPTRLHVRYSNHTRIDVDNFLQGDQHGIGHGDVEPRQELPSVIIFIVKDAENGMVSARDVRRGEHRAVARLIKWPCVFPGHLSFDERCGLPTRNEVGRTYSL